VVFAGAYRKLVHPDGSTARKMTGLKKNRSFFIKRQHTLSPASCYYFQNSRRQEDPQRFFIGLEDGDRLTVFFNRTVVFRGLDGFQDSDYKRAFLGFSDPGNGPGGFSQLIFPKRKKLIDIGI